LQDPHLKYRFATVTDKEDVEGSELGRGAFGVTYLAEEIATGKLLAVKVIRKEAPGFTPCLFEQEVDCLTAVHDHRGIVTLHEACSLLPSLSPSMRHVPSFLHCHPP
jgi:serine/threonine protein kinase